MKKRDVIAYCKSVVLKGTGILSSNIYSAILVVFFVLAPVSGVVHAATMNVVSNPNSATVGQPFRIDVNLDTQGDTANAIQGTISFPTNLFTLQSVDDGESIINFWVEPPQSVASGEVAFSGIVPGGFMGAASSVVGLILDPVSQGTGTISIGDLKLLRNDGQGSMIPVTTKTESIVVLGAASNTPPAEPIVSQIAPEFFIPVISKDLNVYGGKYFLAFSTTDKGSGIDHYEVLEVPSHKMVGVVSSWQVATSPYLLQDQSLTSDIYVRAVDHAMNFIIVKLPARYSAPAKTNVYLEFAAIVFICISLFTIVLLRRRRVI